MNSQAQCAFCFETLAANLERRKPLSLAEVSELWAAYHDHGEANKDEDDLADGDEDVETEAASLPPATVATSRNPRSSTSKPSAIDRLLAPSPSTASSSSISSTGTSTPNTSSAEASKSSSSSSIFSALRGGDRPDKSATAPPTSTAEYPLFVTWNTVSKHGDKRLRGCIGTFEPLGLEEGLRSYALTSALEDTRFSPISKRELPTLQNAITLLTNFEPASHPLEWDLGKHGIRISFTHHGRRYGSTYLPDVAKEQGWTKEETLASLMRKAGFNGKRDEWRSMRSLSVVRYQGEKSDLGYEAWKEWRDWVTEEHGR